jgi:ABC-type antimicrobial peptide transport system permease subunit
MTGGEALERHHARFDSDLPLGRPAHAGRANRSAEQQERIFAALTASFGVLALALACVGIYGVMAYSVAQRRTEIGVRLALGAIPRQVLAMVVREAMTISPAGIAGGLTLAFLLSSLVKPLLYGLRPHDPVVFACAGGCYST